MQFTYDAYVGFLDRARSDGYTVRAFDTPDRTTGVEDQVIMLRHDVDLDLDRAVALAEVEQRHGVSSTYFILLTSPFYNPASASGRERVREIAARGHAVGLHFDPTVYGTLDNVAAFNARCSAEAGQLEHITGVPVETVSFHRPAPALMGSGPELTTPLVHTYLARYVDDMEYCTDSTGVWRYGPPEDRRALARGHAMHFLTHPEWWSNDDMAPGARIRDLLDDRDRRTRAAVNVELAVPVDAD